MDKIHGGIGAALYSDHTFQTVVESAPNAIILVNEAGRITYINKQTQALLGYDRDELLGRKIEVLMPERFRKAHPGLRNAFVHAPTTRNMGTGRDLYALCKDSTEIQVLIGLNPITTSVGTIVHVSIIDITERKVQEAVIQKQLIELEIKNRDLEQFTYIASHDLQEPLRTISNYIQLVQDDFAQIGPDAIEYLKAIDNSAKRMRTLVKGLLDFSRIGAGKVLTEVNCRKIIGDVMFDLSSLIVTNEATITVGEMPVMYTYESELLQLFQNLISNAIKFRKEDLPPEIIIDCIEYDGYWQFSVKDNGIGIDPKYFDRIFHIFQRLNKEDHYQGYGIGLAYSKKIVEMHGGRIWVESSPTSGSIFYFTISNLKP